MHNTKNTLETDNLLQRILKRGVRWLGVCNGFCRMQWILSYAFIIAIMLACPAAGSVGTDTPVSGCS
jgi:hypothetical protein